MLRQELWMFQLSLWYIFFVSNVTVLNFVSWAMISFSSLDFFSSIWDGKSDRNLSELFSSPRCRLLMMRRGIVRKVKLNSSIEYAITWQSWVSNCWNDSRSKRESDFRAHRTKNLTTARERERRDFEKRLRFSRRKRWTLMLLCSLSNREVFCFPFDSRNFCCIGSMAAWPGSRV